MCHKAYTFDFGGFQQELASILYAALASNSGKHLAGFIDANVNVLTLPWEASPLPSDWRSTLETGDVQELGDLALTKFYDADGDFGVQEHWRQLDAQLASDARRLLLGEPFGPPDRIFDPGRMGSYFQSPAQVREACEVLAKLGLRSLAPFQEGAQQAAECGRGLYVTF